MSEQRTSVCWLSLGIRAPCSYCQSAINPFQFLYSTSVGIPAKHLSFRIHLSVYNMALKANSEVSRLVIYLFNLNNKMCEKILNVKSNVNWNCALSIENGYKYVPVGFKTKNKRHETSTLCSATQSNSVLTKCLCVVARPNCKCRERYNWNIVVCLFVAQIRRYQSIQNCRCCDFLVAPRKWENYSIIFGKPKKLMGKWKKILRREKNDAKWIVFSARRIREQYNQNIRVWRDELNSSVAAYDRSSVN